MGPGERRNMPEVSEEQLQRLLEAIAAKAGVSHSSRVKVDVEKFSGEDSSLFHDWSYRLKNQIRD